MRTKFNVLCTLKSRGQNRILWQSVDLWTMMPSLSRMIKDDSYCLGWLKEKSFVEQEVGCFSLSLSLLLPTYVVYLFDKRVPSSWYQFTHVWSISVTEDERNFFHYGWHQWHPGKYVLDEQEFLLIQNVNQFLSEDQSKALKLYDSMM